MSGEADVGLHGQGKIEGIQIQAVENGGWSTWRGQWPSSRVISIRNEECLEGKDR